MDIIYWLIPLSIIILMVAVAFFFWAVRNGQFDDLDSPAVNILFDDDSNRVKSNE
ncbi:MAG: cbb3-type cytochrome oxidase assembly protein CcoS [Kangiellaceae bacterium]|nr:cbb3-type cytochrome oxidase assembly protein CcoS [Kangiellaceae bacterium]